MKQIKRPQILDDYNTNNKKFKLHDSSQIINNRSLFEDLANETIYEIFDYLAINHSHEAFFNLNKRFQNLFLYSNLPIQVNISTISKTNFERYHQNVILPNKHRINYLRLSNPFVVDIIFSPPRIISEFIQLEILILDTTNTKHLRNIFTHAMILRKLHSLVINLADEIQDLRKIFQSIFSLPKLKYCKISYKTKDGDDPFGFYLGDYRNSSVEHLVINARFPYGSLDSLLMRLPRLRHLSINCLFGDRFSEFDPEFIKLKYLKSILFKLDKLHLNQLEIMIKKLFSRVEILRLTINYDQTYLDAKRWEQLITSYMPKLRIFDMNYNGSVGDNSSLYHDVINEFESKFWIERGWFFTHHHESPNILYSGIFYSTDPYRRKDYTFNWQFDKQMCPHVYENNLNSIKHVLISGREATNNSINYFPNATELTIKQYFQTSDNLTIITTLNRIIPLKQLTKLKLDCYKFSFEEIINLLCSTPNLHTLKFVFFHINEQTQKLIEQNTNYQYVSKTNKIKHIELHHWFKLEELSFFFRLFPQIEYLKSGFERKQIEQIIHYLLTKNIKLSPHLFFLCIIRLPKICLKELDRLIQREKLLQQYSMKFINRDLYLWW